MAAAPQTAEPTRHPIMKGLPRSMKLLVALMVVMGVAIIGGLIFVVIVAVQRLGDSAEGLGESVEQAIAPPPVPGVTAPAQAGPPPAGAPVSAVFPPTAEIIALVPVGAHLFVHLRDDTGDHLFRVDGATGLVSGPLGTE